MKASSKVHPKRYDLARSMMLSPFKILLKRIIAQKNGESSVGPALNVISVALSRSGSAKYGGSVRWVEPDSDGFKMGLEFLFFILCSRPVSYE